MFKFFKLIMNFDFFFEFEYFNCLINELYKQFNYSKNFLSLNIKHEIVS